MNLQNLLNRFAGTAGQTTSSMANSQSAGNALRGITSNIPGGLAGGAVAGGVMALLMGNKTARKVAGKAATYGGAAILGGLAYKAYKSWQHDHTAEREAAPAAEAQFKQQAMQTTDVAGNESYQLALVGAMIAAARADGHIDADEQQRIFSAVDEMNLSPAMKGAILDMFNQPLDMNQLAQGAATLEQKSELYLASCLVIELDDNREYAHLAELNRILQLPPGLEGELRAQAQQALREAA